MANITFDVPTYNKSMIVALGNQNAFMQLLNTQYKDFSQVKGQKGATLTFDAPPTVDFQPNLGVSSWGSFSQKQFPITVDQEGSIPIAVPNLEYLFNLKQDNYLTKIAQAAVAELGSRIAKNVALQIETNTFLSYGDGSSSILSFQALNQAVMNFDDMGMPTESNDMCMIIPTTASAAITGQGLSQFVNARNEKIASTWYVASIGAVDVYHSNSLPKHISGNVSASVNDDTLTVVSINGAGNQIVFSGSTNLSDANAIKIGDVLTFQNADLRNLTYYGGVVTDQPVQVVATTNAASDGAGNVTVDFDPPLISTGGRDDNISTPIVAGQTAKVAGNHTCGVFFSKAAYMLGLPPLGSTSPYESSSAVDPVSKLSMRVYQGFLTDTADTGFVHQAAWGSYLVGRYGMRLLFPY